MLHPVGNLPPAVYWRRRLIFVVLPALLILLLVVYLLAGNGGSPNTPAAASTTPSSASAPAGSSSAATVTTSSAPPGTTSAVPAPSPTPTAPDPGRACTAADLQVQAAVGKPSYAVNSRPDLYLVVTNVSASPCNQDLADPQIVLTITAGDVRVWGSHDCGIQPGTDVAALAPNVAVRRGIIWSGLTSVPGCTGNRLVAQAGTYDLVAALAGKTSEKVQFQLV